MINRASVSFLVVNIACATQLLTAADTSVLHRYNNAVLGFLMYTEAVQHDEKSLAAKITQERSKFDEACQKEKEYMQQARKEGIDPLSRPSFGTAIEWRLEGRRTYPRRQTERSVEAFLIPIGKTIHEDTTDQLEKLVYATVVQCERERGDDFWMSELDKAYTWIPNGDNTRSLKIKAEIAPEFIMGIMAQKEVLRQMLIQKLGAALPSNTTEATRPATVDKNNRSSDCRLS